MSKPETGLAFWFWFEIYGWLELYVIMREKRNKKQWRQQTSRLRCQFYAKKDKKSTLWFNAVDNTGITLWIGAG